MSPGQRAADLEPTEDDLTHVRENLGVVAEIIARELQNTYPEDIGNIITGSLGNVVEFTIYERDRFGVLQTEDPIVVHAVLHPGPFEATGGAA